MASLWSIGSGIIACSMGFLGMSSWIFRVPVLSAVWSDGSTMKFNTAIGVSFLGLCLVLPRYRVVLGAIVFAIGLISILEFIFAKSLGIDQLFFTDSLTPFTQSPGRTSPSTALALALVAASMVIARKNPSAGQWASIAGLMVSADALVIHVFSIGLGSADTGMALQTGVGVISAALGSAAIIRGKGPLSVFTSERVGGRLTRRLLPPLMVGLIFIGWGTARAIQGTTYRPSLLIAAQTIGTCSILGIAAWWYAGQLNREDARREHAQRQAEAANRDLEKKIIERTEELSSFVNAISHDIRAPIRAISGYSEMILEASETSRDSEEVLWLKRISVKANGLGVLVDDLLRYTRVSGAMPHPQEIDLTELTRSVFEEVAPSICVVEVEENLSVVADKNLLHLILLNLLGNACKYSPSGGTILVGKKGATVFVRDQGVGFDMADRELIFEPLRRLVSEAQFAGTGMGLANVRRAVERHGGRIWVESSPGNGSTFSFVLDSSP